MIEDEEVYFGKSLYVKILFLNGAQYWGDTTWVLGFAVLISFVALGNLNAFSDRFLAFKMGLFGRMIITSQSAWHDKHSHVSPLLRDHKTVFEEDDPSLINHGPS